jgi:hypothetical protein
MEFSEQFSLQHPETLFSGMRNNIAIVSKEFCKKNHTVSATLARIKATLLWANGASVPSNYS